MGGFSDLIVWQKSICFSRSVYELTSKLPSEEKYGMISQTRRAVVSVASNIAEGHGRTSKREFARFLAISLGSLREVQTLLILTKELGMVDPALQLQECEEVAKMIYGLMKSLEVKG